jgi:hypothetical protein
MEEQQRRQEFLFDHDFPDALYGAFDLFGL